MKYRPFGRTGWQVSEIGVGTWTMGGMWGPVSDREAVRAIRAARELGANFLDTALVYGTGRAERLIALALKRQTDQAYIATKVPPKNGEWPARHEIPVEEAFPADWIIRCTERSLRNLRRSWIDLQQFHVWSPRWLAERDDWFPTVERLKRAGKIRAFGISVNDMEPETALEAVSMGLIDSVQVIYNLFEQTPAEALLPACQQRQVAVIVRVPLDEGSLTGTFTRQTVFLPGDWRQSYFEGPRLAQTAERVERLMASPVMNGQPLAQAALRFCLSHPAVSTVIPGMRTVKHVEANCAASDGQPFTPQELTQLREHAWPRNFYQRLNGPGPIPVRSRAHRLISAIREKISRVR